MKTIMHALVLVMSVFTMTHFQVAEAANEKHSVGQIRRMLRDGTFDAEKSCLDEYAKRSTHLEVKVGLLPPAGAGTAVGALYGVAYASAGYAVSTGMGLGGIFFAVFMGIFAFMGAVGIALTWEGIAIAQLIRHNFVTKSLAEAYDASGKHFDKFVRKYFRKYKGDRGKFSKEDIAKAMVKGDESGAFCDGSVTGRSGSLRKRLAKKKHMFRYVHHALTSVQ